MSKLWRWHSYGLSLPVCPGPLREVKCAWEGGVGATHNILFLSKETQRPLLSLLPLIPTSPITTTITTKIVNIPSNITEPHHYLITIINPCQYLTTFITITSIPAYNPGPYILGPLLLQHSPTWGPWFQSVLTPVNPSHTHKIHFYSTSFLLWNWQCFWLNYLVKSEFFCFSWLPHLSSIFLLLHFLSREW